MAPTEALLTVTALTKCVPGPRLLFKGLDLKAGAGEAVAVVGEFGVVSNHSNEHRPHTRRGGNIKLFVTAQERGNRSNLRIFTR